MKYSIKKSDKDRNITIPEPLDIKEELDGSFTVYFKEAM